MKTTKDIIIERATFYLHKEGLRFSVDDLAKDLKMSKKTIYSFFKDKKELADGIYDYSYKLAIENMCLPVEEEAYYFASYLDLLRDDIFNRYDLSIYIKRKAYKLSDDIFDVFYEKYLKELKGTKNALKIIVEKSLQSAFGMKNNKKVIKEIMEVLLNGSNN